MIPRRMRFNFDEMPLCWAKSRDFSTIVNSGSPLATAFEPYLNKVMARVRDSLPETKSAVKRDIDLFIKQESYHYHAHVAFNKELYAAYPKLKEFQNSLAKDHQDMFDKRSLAFNMAYCAGFENLACYMAKFTYEKAYHYYEGACRPAATLWLWHNAEEFEHRSACSNALNAISSNYFNRIHGFIYFMRLVMGYDKKIKKYMFEVDRASMTDEERKASIAFEKKYNKEFSRYLFSRMIRIFMPFYNPARQTAPASLHQALDSFEQVALQPEPVGA